MKASRVRLGDLSVGFTQALAAALREHGRRDRAEPRQAVHDDGIQAGHRASRIASSGAFVSSIGPSGATCSVRSVAAVICANTGAATMPP